MKELTLPEMMAVLGGEFDRQADTRKGPNLTYRLRDAGVSAFAVFFMQSPSFLAHQRDMQRQTGQNNARSLFGVQAVPSDPQIRNLLDAIDPQQLGGCFWQVFDWLKEAGELRRYTSYEGHWLCSLDGTQYFASQKIHCPQCSVQNHGERTHYAHTAITPVLVAADEARVISLEPEFITPQDGQEKQDCERAAAKRWLGRNAARFGTQAVTFLGDDLYCNQPFCELLLAQAGHNFILTCKPDSHAALSQELALRTHIGAVSQVSERHWTGHHYESWTYRFANDLPLRVEAPALAVNWCELTLRREDTKQLLYHNAFATRHLLTPQTVQPIVAAGRARWKIENENNHVLKNHGYHLHHNFGHGQTYLSQTLLFLNLLAFLFHTVLDLCDQTYRRIRAELGTRQTFFNDIQALTRYLFFSDWPYLLSFMSSQLQLKLDPG